MMACGQVSLLTDAHILNSSDCLEQYDLKAVIEDVLRYRKQPLRVVLCEPCGMSSKLNGYMEPKHASDWGRDDPESSMTLFRVSLPLIDLVPPNTYSFDGTQAFVKHPAENGTLWH
jgi:hypothetical protein